MGDGRPENLYRETWNSRSNTKRQPSPGWKDIGGSITSVQKPGLVLPCKSWDHGDNGSPMVAGP